jgi:Methyltransferase domain
VIDNGFARPFLDRWWYFRKGRAEGINRLRAIAGGFPLLLKYRPGSVPEELWTPRRVNILVSELHLRSYLEIGVFEGETFANVNARHRYGVDPEPLFEPVLLPRGAKFAVMTSDDFFSMIRPWKRFDVAFVDGLHTLEQTYRDVINTFAHLRRGVVLIDDTVPSDEYSAIPDQDESYRAREAAGLEGRPWHGDVWRVVMLFERHHPELEWRTIIDNGNPQTLVWRRRRGAKVTAASADDIALAKQPAYVEVFANGVPQYFRATSESLALAECVQSIRS